jgi:hypothetical protein
MKSQRWGDLDPLGLSSYQTHTHTHTHARINMEFFHSSWVLFFACAKIFVMSLYVSISKSYLTISVLLMISVVCDILCCIFTARVETLRVLCLMWTSDWLLQSTFPGLAEVGTVKRSVACVHIRYKRCKLPCVARKSTIWNGTLGATEIQLKLCQRWRSHVEQRSVHLTPRSEDVLRDEWRVLW